MILLYLSHTHSCDIKMPPLGEPKILCTSYSETASKEYRVSQKNWTKLGAIVVLADKLINIAPNFVQFFGTPCVACITDQSKQVRRIMH